MELGVITTAVDEWVWSIDVEVGLVAVEYWEENITVNSCECLARLQEFV